MKFLSYILSPFFLFSFFLILIIFHPLQWFSLRFISFSTYQKIVDMMNYFLVKNLLLIGVKVRLENSHQLPLDTTLIFVSNHQSLFDISPVSWFFRKYKPKFVSKQELGKGIPSVSFNLRNGGAALIDRNNGKQAIAELVRYAKNINKEKWSAAIFPEGTRGKDGKPKEFATNGLKVITKYNQEGYIVPLTVNNSWKVFKYGKFPFGVGSPITIKTHAPIKISSLPFNELAKKVEHTIIKDIN